MTIPEMRNDGKSRGRRRTLVGGRPAGGNPPIDGLPYLGYVGEAPPGMPAPPALARRLRVATYNVHRWTGPLGGNRFSPRLAKDVIHEIDADVFALQEVLRPFARHDPLEAVARDKGLHVAFVVTRVHKRGELGNAILSRWPIASIVTLNLTVGRLDRRAALAAEFHGGEGHSLSIVATHLALIDRYRRLQVDTLLDHPRLQGPVVLLGDLNAWRRCSATRALERELPKEHKNLAWPASFPAARPILALDRIYARGARVVQLESHDTSAARRGSDHLPVVALIQLNTP